MLDDDDDEGQTALISKLENGKNFPLLRNETQMSTHLQVTCGVC